MQINSIIEPSLSALEQSGAERRGFSSDTVELREITGMAILRLRSFSDLPANSIVGIGLPEMTGQCSNTQPDVLCLGPHEWLIIGETEQASEVLQQLQDAIPPEQAVGWDHSDGLAVFRLNGSGAPWLLNKLSCLDFQSAALSGPHCAHTRVGQVRVLIHYHEDSHGKPVFDLLFDRSLARYLGDLLEASAAHADELAEAYETAA